MSTNPVNISITDGPNADRLVDAFKYACDQTVTFKPWFELEFTARTAAPYTSRTSQRTRVLAQIMGISYESGSPGMFIVKMNVLDGTYECFYDANQRKGSVSKKI